MIEEMTRVEKVQRLARASAISLQCSQHMADKISEIFASAGAWLVTDAGLEWVTVDQALDSMIETFDA